MNDVNFLKELLYTKNNKALPDVDYEKIISDFEQFLHYLFNSVQDGISILDKDLKIIGTNLTMDKWFSYKKPFLGKKCYEIYHERSRPCKNCPTIKTIKSKKSNVSIIKYKTPNTQEGWHELFSFPLFDDHHNVAAIIEYVRDITFSRKIKMVSDNLKKRLMLQNQTLQEQETALKVLFSHREQELKSISEKILSNINLLINPLVNELKIKLKNQPEIQQINQLEKYLKNITDSLISKLVDKMYDLTPKEIQIASLIKEGKSSKIIAQILGISLKAVEFHRLNIRKKFNLKNTKANLQSFLLHL